LLGYARRSTGADGKSWHQISVKVKRSGVDVRARKGFWALTTADVEKISKPTPDVAKPVQTALASIATIGAVRQLRADVIHRAWRERGIRVTLIWEPPLPAQGASVRREQPGRVRCLRDGEGRDLVFRGRSPGCRSGFRPVRPCTERHTGGRCRALAVPPLPPPHHSASPDAPPGKIERA
jgi:hypothetical protein